MGFANTVTITLSSVGQSRPLALDWMNGAPTAVSITGSSSGTFSYGIQYSLDDLQQTANPVWINDPNATAQGWGVRASLMQFVFW